ncbi:MAG: glycosyltransferase family 2 protein [Caldiserica bacterium]|jgi:glycosyltransferase involved in cell wall biosynthesis|nr:glycosyltransferase family 2 protein [Caldisericota bacterium]MDH7562823.1 glycosyltransferase family 2 protein [Caldisericota bacterium]
MDYNVALYIAGFVFGLLSFFPFQTLKKGKPKNQHKVSVVIPARNEEKNLPGLIKCLHSQTFKPFEIIVVDDESSDKTAEVAESFGAKVVKIDDKPEEVVGKSFACLKGWEASRGELIIFLDADVRLKEKTLEKLVYTYEKEKGVLSVWPYHQIGGFWENFSFMFNLIGAMALNSSSFLHRLISPRGLFGPCILIDRKTYEETGGHKNVLHEIAEDLALGKVLRKQGIKVRNFLGRKDLSFRMYGNGFRDLFLGWSKNFSKGAISIHPLEFLVLFVFLTSLVSVTINLSKHYLFGIIFGLSFLVLGRVLGNFHPILLFLFPVHLIIFLLVFSNSIFSGLIKGEVKWKGRKVRVR